MTLINPDTFEPISTDAPAIEFERPLCSLCLRGQCHDERFGMFIIAIVRGVDPVTNEPMVRDGIFDHNGKLAKLLTCPQCLPKLVAFRQHNDPKRLPKGPIRKLCEEIWRRQPHPTTVTH